MGLVTKIDVARRQLETAIELLLEGRDTVSVHTLALNAFEITSTLARHRGERDWLEIVREDAASAFGLATKGAFYDVFHGHRNFFKHADRDPEGLVAFDDHQNDGVVCLAVIQFGELAERSALMWSYFFWFYAVYPEFEPPDSIANEVTAYRHASKLGRAAQLAIGREIVRSVRARLGAGADVDNHPA